MSGRLAEKVALITAAGQGIGRASALTFASEGATVWATDINRETLASLKAECPQIQTSILDVRDSDAVAALAAQTGRLDVLFNCAGYVHQGDSIINMSSAASSIKGAPNRFVYGTTKAAVIGLTKAIAADTVAKGIRCNAICPGTTETPSLEERIAAQGDAAAARAAFLARQAMGRLGRPEEIANLALYLASDESSFTTGQALVIDGGWTI
jgi:2-keto-3-deoxy-L-fuconate dehydrogenase